MHFIFPAILQTNVLFLTLALDPSISWTTETALLTLLVTFFATHRTRFSAAAATFCEKFMFTATLLAMVILDALATDSHIARTTETPLLTFLLALPDRTMLIVFGTGLVTLVAAVGKYFIGTETSWTLIILDAFTVHANESRFAEASFVT